MRNPILVCLLMLVNLPTASSMVDTLSLSKGVDIDEVVITGTRSETDSRRLPSTVTVIGRDMIDDSHESSLLPVLNAHVPGLFVTSRGILGYGVSTGAAGGMSLRGIGNSPTSGLLVLIDGHPQYMGLMGHPIADAYQSVIAEKVEVVRGPASMLYGSNAMGGVINIVTRQADEGSHTRLRAGYGSFNTLTSEVTNQTKAKDFGSTVSAFYNRTDGHRRDMGFEQMGGSAKLSYTLSSAWETGADLNLTHFNASNPGPVSAPRIDNDSHITRGVTSLYVQNRYEKTSGSVTAFYNWGRHRINDGYVQGGTPLNYRFNSKDHMAGLSAYQNVRLFEGNLTTLGVDYQHFGGKAWNRFPATDSRQMLVDKNIDDIAGYVDMRQDITQRLTLDAGVRFDHNSHVGNEWVPQGGISLHLPRHIEMKAVVGKGFRNPTIREMYMFPPQNPDLQPERVINYEIAFSQHIPQERLSYGVNLFYLTGSNLIQTVRVPNGTLNVNTGNIENMGIECEVQWQISPSWRASAQYSWLHMERPLLASPEHKACATVGYSDDRWSVSSDVQYVHGLYTALDTPERENFLLWNLCARYRIFRFLTIFAKGENLLAQKYEINEGYPMPRATCMGGFDIQF